jgi:2-iminobutanoate/2-iminopropanoate deaminase
MEPAMPRIDHVTREVMRPLLEPYGLSEAVKANGMLTLGGQTGIDASHRIVAGGIKAQAVQAFRNIREIVELAGGTPEDIVHLTWYLVDDGRAFVEAAIDVTAARDEVMPGIKPGSTAVQVKALLTPDILVEIQAVAAL